MKKLLLLLLSLSGSAFAVGSPVGYVQISNGSTQLGGFNTSTGTVANAFSLPYIAGTQCLQETNGIVSGTGLTCAQNSSGVGSTLAIASGPVVVSSPTAILSFIGNDFLTAFANSATTYVLLNPGTTDFIHNQTTQQAGTLYIASGTVTNFTIGTLSGNLNMTSDSQISMGTPVFRMSSSGGISMGSSVGGGSNGQVCIGPSACQHDNEISDIGIGFFALNQDSIDGNNIAIGEDVMGQNGGSLAQNVGIGYHAMTGIVGGNFANSTAIGALALGSGAINSLGECTAVGASALGTMTLGVENTAVGFDTLGTLINGINNTAVGNYALYRSTNGNSNVALGEHAGGDDPSFPAIPGYAAVHSQGGIFIGANSGVVSTATFYTDASAIGINARVGASHTMQLGATNGTDDITVHMSSAIVDGNFSVGNITVSTVTATGFIQFASYAKATFATTTPAAVGQQYYCSDCTALTICISTGTTRGAWSSPTSRTTACN